MNTAWMKARQTKFTGYVVLYTAIVITVLAVINFLANRHNKSYDSTANKRFSLSDQTEKVVKGLTQDVRFRYFDQQSGFVQAKDLLDRYDNLSPKLSVEYIDLLKKPTLAKEAGVRNQGALIIQSALKREEARSISEEEITSALIRSLKTGERTVCFVSGSGEAQIDDSERAGFSQAKEQLERNNYKTRTISLLEKPEVPKDCTVLAIAGPKSDYVPPAVNAVKSYVESGGRALILLDAPLKMGREEISDNEAFLGVLGGWGVTAEKNFVLDPVSQAFGLGAQVALVSAYDSHVIVREMKGSSTGFPFARSLQVKNGDKTAVEKLFSTTENSVATKNLVSVSEPSLDQKGPFILAAAGTFNTGQQGQQGRFVVYGSSMWASNQMLRFSGNRDLFLNTMNWLSSDEDLISIRPKEPEDRRLTLTRRQMNLVFYLSVIGFPAIVIIAGLGVWWRRR